MKKKSTVIDTRGLTRHDKELLSELAETLKVIDAMSKPAMKASSLERVILSNLKSYTNLDGNYRKWVGRKRKFVERIREQLTFIQNDIFGLTTYKAETIQCRSKVVQLQIKELVLKQNSALGVGGLSMSNFAQYGKKDPTAIKQRQFINEIQSQYGSHSTDHKEYYSAVKNWRNLLVPATPERRKEIILGSLKLDVIADAEEIKSLMKL